MNRLTSLITKSVFAILISGGLLAVSAQAQSGRTERATIPFAFSANGQHIAAGSYEVKLFSERIVSLRNLNTGKQQMIMVRPDTGREIESRGKLVFNRYEGRSYLSQVWLPGTNTHSELVQQHESSMNEAKAGTPASSLVVGLQ